MKRMGGYKEPSPADDDIKELVKSVQTKVEENTNEKYSTFEAISYTSQVVAGTNYTIKVKVDNDKYIHVSIFKPLPHTGKECRVSDVQTGKTLNDQL